MTNHNKRYLNVYFTQTEYDICRYIGEMRYKITAQHVPDNRQDNTQDPMQMCIDGVLTEYAVAKTLNLSFDLNCDFRQFGADLTNRDGKPLEVEVRDLQGLRIETESQLGVNSKKFGFREDVEAVIVMNPSGFFRITDEQSKVTKGQLQVWPLPLIVMTNENYQADRGNRSNGSDETG